MTGGVAMLDYDGDGRRDLFFVNGAALADPMAPGQAPDKSSPVFWNRLYRNQSDGTFTDVTEAAGVRGQGYGMGAAAGDYNNDGRTDLYVTNYGKNILYLNQGDGTFRDVTSKAGVGASGWSAGAAWLDYNRDGALDLFVTRYLDWNFPVEKWCGARKPGHRSYCHPDEFKPVTHLLFRKDGNDSFTDVSKESGIAAHPGKGLGAAINDYDRDGWPDIAVANDSYAQQLFRNNGDGTFSETGLEAGVAYDEDGNPYAGMGIDFEDYDNDGWPDLFINALANQRYWLYRNVKGSFEPVSGSSGIGEMTRLHSGWGAKLLDHDNDGWRDLLVAQGHVMDNIELTEPGLRYREPPLLLRNRAGRFEVVPGLFKNPLAARGLAAGDLNNDGAIDAAINCNDSPAVLLLNAAPGRNHWLSVNTIGSKSNRDGIGARIRLVFGTGKELHGFVSTAGSYLSSNDKRVHFGLGAEARVSLVEVIWPSGTVQRMENVVADQILTVKEPR